MIRGVMLVLQALLWLVLLRFALRALGAALVKRAAPARPAAAGPQRIRAAEELVLDRVCDTHVPRSTALVARVGGREQYFCSTACRDKALAGVARAS